MPETNTNPSFSQIISQVPSGSGGTLWTNINHLTSAPGSGAQNTSYTDYYNDFTEILQGTNIQWLDDDNNPITIPDTATIQGVKITISAQQTAGTSAVFANIWLLGVPGAEEQHNGAWGITSSPQTFTFGGPYSWLGAPQITAAMLNAPGFGWAIQTTNTGEPGTGCKTTVYSVTIQAWYTPASIPIGPVGGSIQDQASNYNIWGPTAITLESVTVTPSDPTITPTGTQQFVATALYSDGSTPIVTNLSTWTSSNTAVATINSSGLATAVGSGTTTITATFKGVHGSTVLTVYGIPTLLQAGGSNFNTGSAVIIDITNNPTPGNLLVALAFCAPENVGPVVGITGFIEQATYTNAGQDGTVWVGTRVVQAGDGNSYTVNFTGSAGGGDIGGVLYEISNWTSTASSAGLASVSGQIASTPNMTAGEAITFAVLVLPFGTTTNTYTPSDFIESASNRGVWAGYYVGNVSAVPGHRVTFTGAWSVLLFIHWNSLHNQHRRVITK